MLVSNQFLNLQPKQLMFTKQLLKSSDQLLFSQCCTILQINVYCIPDLPFSLLLIPLPPPLPLLPSLISPLHLPPPHPRPSPPNKEFDNSPKPKQPRYELTKEQKSLIKTDTTNKKLWDDVMSSTRTEGTVSRTTSVMMLVKPLALVIATSKLLTTRDNVGTT